MKERYINMSKQRIIIITCGTSLFETKEGNINSICSFNPPPDYPMNCMIKWFNSEIGQTGDIEIPAQRFFDRNSHCKGYDENKKLLLGMPLACSLHIRQENQEKGNAFEQMSDPFPAEVSSILVDYFCYKDNCNIEPKNNPTNNGTGDILYLLYSDTRKGEAAALWIKHLFEKKPFNKFFKVEEPKKLEGINPIDVTAFSQTGLASLAKEIFSIQKKHEDKQIILDITGGFKGVLAPAEALAHCLPGVTVRYLFESSPSHVIIPALPLSFDVLCYFEHRGALRALDSATPEQGEALRGSLPESLQGLYEPSDDGYVKHPIGKKLTELIDKMKSDESLPSPYGSARNFAALIDDKNMFSYFKGLVLMRQYHWHGDVIPETVPHDRGHAQRLLEMAFQLLMPLKQANPDFFNEVLPPWAVLVLLCSLWMHDVGHAGGKIKPDWHDKDINVNPYPSIVRDLHHYLGYERIFANKDEEFFPNKIEAISMPSINGYQLNKAVAVSYLFHRKKLNWDGKTDFSNVSPYWNWLKKDHEKPLKDHFSQWHNDNLLIMHRVIALQRLIDAFDVMNERVGALELRDHKTRRLAEDIEADWDIFLALENQLCSMPDIFLKTATCKSEWNDLKKKMMEYWGKPMNGSEISGNFEGMTKKKLVEKSSLWKEIEPGIAKCLEQAIRSDNAIFQQYLSCIYRLLFKPIQMAHYAKHAAVESTVILPKDFSVWKKEWGTGVDAENSIARFEVIFTYGSEAQVKEKNAWVENYVKPLLQSEIKEEFTPQVKTALRDMRLEFSNLVARMHWIDTKEIWEKRIDINREEKT